MNYNNYFNYDIIDENYPIKDLDTAKNHLADYFEDQRGRIKLAANKEWRQQTT